MQQSTPARPQRKEVAAQRAKKRRPSLPQRGLIADARSKINRRTRQRKGAATDDAPTPQPHDSF